MDVRELRCALAAGLCLLLVGCGEAAQDPDSALAAASQERREPRGMASDRFTNIWLTTHHGEGARFYDDLIRDKVVMINFMYTTCSKIWPKPRVGALFTRWSWRSSPPC